MTKWNKNISFESRLEQMGISWFRWKAFFLHVYVHMEYRRVRPDSIFFFPLYRYCYYWFIFNCGFFLLGNMQFCTYFQSFPRYKITRMLMAFRYRSPNFVSFHLSSKLTTNSWFIIQLRIIFQHKILLTSTCIFRRCIEYDIK